MDNLTNLLKEATKDLLTEETLKAINDAVEAKAEEKAQLAVEAALVKQDEDYADKLQKVLEAIDADHSEKLDKIVQRIDESHAAKFQHALDLLDESHTGKLQKIVTIYENALKAEAQNFKKNLVDQISNYIDLYIDKTIPAEQIAEATANTRAKKIIAEVKRLIGVSDEFINQNIKEALLDGKRQIDEAKETASNTADQLKLITEKAENLEKQLFLEKELENYPAPKKEYMYRVLSEKKLDVIKENLEYVSSMYDKKEEVDNEDLKNSTTAKTKDVDVGKAPEVVNESKSYSSNDLDDGAAHVAKEYVSEFTKKPY